MIETKHRVATLIGVAGLTGEDNLVLELMSDECIGYLRGQGHVEDGPLRLTDAGREWLKEALA